MQKSKPPLKPDEIDEMELARSNNKMNAKSDFSTLAFDLHSALSADIDRIPLDKELRPIKDQVLSYIRISGEHGNLPTMQGISRSLGHSRQSVYQFMDRNPQHETTKFLSLVKDGLSEMLDLAALSSAVQPVVAMFLLKCQYSYIDRAELHISTTQEESPLGPVDTLEQIEARKARFLAAANDD